MVLRLGSPGSLQFPCRAMQNVPVSWSWRAAVVRRKPQMAKPLSRCAALRRAGWMATGWLLDGGGIHSGTAGFRFCKAWNQWMSHCHGSDISRAPFDPDGYLVESYLILQATSRPQGLEAQKPLTTDGRAWKKKLKCSTEEVLLEPAWFPIDYCLLHLYLFLVPGTA